MKPQIIEGKCKTLLSICLQPFSSVPRVPYEGVYGTQTVADCVV